MRIRWPWMSVARHERICRELTLAALDPWRERIESAQHEYHSALTPGWQADRYNLVAAETSGMGETEMRILSAINDPGILQRARRWLRNFASWVWDRFIRNAWVSAGIAYREEKGKRGL